MVVWVYARSRGGSDKWEGTEQTWVVPSMVVVRANNEVSNEVSLLACESFKSEAKVHESYVMDADEKLIQHRDQKWSKPNTESG